MTPRRAFTLIELLVVISIIALLAGLMLGGVTAVQASARQIACANNLRQIGLGVFQYANEQEGLLPGGLTPTWDVHVAALLDATISASEAPRWLRCPEDRRARSTLAAPHRSYFMPSRRSLAAANDGLIEEPANTDPALRTLLLAQITLPGDTVLLAELFTDKLGNQTSNAAGTGSWYTVGGWLSAGDAPHRSGGTGFYHRTNLDFAYADGRVAAQPPGIVAQGYTGAVSQWKGIRP